MRNTTRETRRNSCNVLLWVPSHGRASVSQSKELTYNSSLRTQDVAWKICRGRWMIGTDRERKSGKSMLAVRLDDNDITFFTYGGQICTVDLKISSLEGGDIC